MSGCGNQPYGAQHERTPSKLLCDGVEDLQLEETLHPHRCTQSSSATKRRRKASLSSPSRKRADTRRRSRSLQFDGSTETISENQPKQKFVSMAEAMLNFQRNTPERFHTKPVIDGAHRGRVEKQQGRKVRVTVPQSPKFVSQFRARPVNYPSKEEREEAELQEMQKFVFKAAPLKAEILKDPQPLPKVDPRPATKPSPFKLTEVKNLHFGSDKNGFTIKDLGVKKKIFPEEPQCARGMEAKAVVPVLEKKDNDFCVVKKELEQPGIRKPTPTKRTTKPEPFTFEERDKIRIQKKEEKIRQFLEDEKKAREFHANPIPKAVKCSSSFSDRQVTLSSLTQPKPFHLHTEERMAVHEAALKAKLEEERRAAEEALQFKAKPPVVLQKKPFEPVRPHRVLKEITDICLNTELRSKEREKFEKKLQEQKQMFEEYKRKLQEAKEREEEEERARIRQQAVHKAQPIAKYPPIVITKSSKELTLPQSPFSRTKRANSSDSI